MSDLLNRHKQTDFLSGQRSAEGCKKTDIVILEHWSEGWNPRSFNAGFNKLLRIRPRGSEEIDGNLELIRAALARAARLLMARQRRILHRKRSIAERFLGKGSEDLSLSILPLIR